MVLPYSKEFDNCHFKVVSCYVCEHCWNPSRSFYLTLWLMTEFPLSPFGKYFFPSYTDETQMNFSEVILCFSEFSFLLERPIAILLPFSVSSGISLQIYLSKICWCETPKDWRIASCYTFLILLVRGAGKAFRDVGVNNDCQV